MTRIEVADGSPYLAGHFPGHPILPAIAHLALIPREGGRPLAEIRHLKLRRPVVPGDVVELSTRMRETAIRFEWRRGDEIVSQGEIVLGDVGADTPVRTERRPPGRYPPPAGLLPHAPPALFVQSIVEVSAQGATTLASVPPDSPFADDRRAPALVTLEAAAQTAAVLEALGRKGDRGGPRVGYIVGARNVVLRTAWLPVAQPLVVTVRPAGQAPPLSVYEFAVGGTQELARGTISTFLTPTPA